MQPPIFMAGLALCILALPVFADNVPATPYAGQHARTIKALPDADIAALRKGEGMGMAKAAELNGYPGPAHVLVLSGELGLTDEQSRRVRLIHGRMGAAAKPLGDALIARERILDRMFAEGNATRERVAAETASIGDLQARLRSVHLAAHLETRALLTPEQVAGYQRLRGYDDTGNPPRHHHPG